MTRLVVRLALFTFSVNLAILNTGCAGDPPSCQQAFNHYYGTGCAYYNLSTGAQISQGDMTTFCQQLAVAEPDRCQDEMDNWLVCTNEVQGEPKCDCSKQYMALLACK